MHARGRHRSIVFVGAIAAIAIVGAGYVAWQAFGGDPPPAATLSSPSPSRSGGSSPADAEGFDGTWGVDAVSGSLAEGTATYAGYRIEEELVGIGGNTAVGRSQQVSGSMTIDGTEVAATEITVTWRRFRVTMIAVTISSQIGDWRPTPSQVPHSPSGSR